MSFTTIRRADAALCLLDIARPQRSPSAVETMSTSQRAKEI
jgi:hypothetical protein